MTNKAQKTVISGVTFQVAPFMAVEGLRLQAHLVRTFGPALGEILGGAKLSDTLDDLDLGGIPKALERLFQELDEDSFEALVKRLLVNVIATWKESGESHSVSFGNDFETAMELVFVGKLFAVYQLLVFVLKVNYPDFFDKVVGGIGRRMRTTPTSGVEETTPPSESGNSATLES